MMGQETDLLEIDNRIQALKKTAQELIGLGGERPFLYRNVSRILASIKMLELNVSDILDIRLEGADCKRPIRL